MQQVTGNISIQICLARYVYNRLRFPLKQIVAIFSVVSKKKSSCMTFYYSLFVRHAGQTLYGVSVLLKRWISFTETQDPTLTHDCILLAGAN